MRQTPPVTVEIEEIVPAVGSNDDSLVARARRRDRDAFALLIEPRAWRLLRTARAILGNETDAYEAAQEALIAAWIQLPRLRDTDRFDAWLNRTLVNKCRDALRRRKRIREIDISGSAGWSGDPNANEPPFGEPSPADGSFDLVIDPELVLPHGVIQGWGG